MTKKIAIIIALGLLCLYQNSYPQSIVPLKIGEKVPDNLWHAPLKLYHKGTVSEITLEKYKGKALVFDFWASWCTNCLIKFKAVETLQAENPGAAVLMVNAKSTRDDSTRVANTLSGKKTGSVTCSLPSIFLDELLVAYFPHKFLPFMVWIDNSGIVRAFTQGELLNREGMASLQKGVTQ